MMMPTMTLREPHAMSQTHDAGFLKLCRLLLAYINGACRKTESTGIYRSFVVRAERMCALKFTCSSFNANFTGGTGIEQERLNAPLDSRGIARVFFMACACVRALCILLSFSKPSKGAS